MKLLVRKFVDLKIALKELEPFIRDGRQVQNGKPFRNFGRMLPREAIANWLLCATANAIDGRQLTFASTDDPIGGDGIIVDQMTDEDFPTEHVMVPVTRKLSSLKRSTKSGTREQTPMHLEKRWSFL